MRFLYFTFCVLLQFSCWVKKPYPEQDRVKLYGWKPVYGADTAYKKLTWRPTPVPMEKPGKIYVKGNKIEKSRPEYCLEGR